MIIVNAKSGDLEKVIRYSVLLNKPEEVKKDVVCRCVTDNLVWVAKDQDFIIGYVMVELFGPEQKYFPDSVFISELYVDEKYRGQGVGSALVETALKGEYPAGYSYFSLTHDPDEAWLTGFYERFGFKKTGTTDVGNIKLVKK